MGDPRPARVAIVTGSGGGLGQVIARTLANEGATVVVSDLDAARGQAVASELGEATLFVQTDITDPTSVDHLVTQTVERYGRVDVLVNNAAITGHHPSYQSYDFLETPLEFWRSILEVNVTGQFICLRAIGQVMARQRQGVMVNVSSIAGLQATPKTSAYSVSKAAVNMLTRCAALELADFGIRVNAVAPNGMHRPEPGRLPPVPSERVLVNRVAEFTDVADVVAFLCSDAARYINGQVISVDGGETVGMRRRRA
ncbi:MAG: SDR family NAD(P)-dependent oxidoreductase [Chloroflexota bacterium]